MLRRELPGMLLGAAVGSMGGASVAQAQTSSPGYSAPYPGDVTLYQALVTDGFWDDAIKAALATHEIVYFPAGHYNVRGPIKIVGDKTILGPRGGTFATQVAHIHHVGLYGDSSREGTNLFEATAESFGGICIANLHIDGGWGGHVVRSVRPQSVFDSLLMETYNGHGIELAPWPKYPFDTTPPLDSQGNVAPYSYGSWGSIIRDCKWVGPDSPTPFRGFQIAVNGGAVLLDNCTAIHGDIGINVDACEALVINRPNTNRQWHGAQHNCGVRFSGAGVKKAVSINGGYIEASANGVWVENVQALEIANTYFDSTDNPSAYGACIYLQNALVKSASIHGCHISQRTAGGTAIVNGGSKTTLSNNVINASGGGAVAITNYALMYVLANSILAGTISSPPSLMKDVGA